LHIGGIMEYQKRPQTFQAERFTHLNDIPKIAMFIDPLATFSWDAKMKEEGGKLSLTLTINGYSHELRMGDFVVRSVDGLEIMNRGEFDKRFIPFNGKPLAYPETNYVTQNVFGNPLNASIGPATVGSIQDMVKESAKASTYSDQISEAIRKSAKSSQGY